MDKDKIIKKNRGNYSYVIRTMDEDGDAVFHVLKYVKTIDKTKSRKTVRKLIDNGRKTQPGIIDASG
ncbi:hypothetical protein [Escherichia coli]|uniref:hypothetical protein n=1 Tax=Escherichia coli TaxID=562 RepID=UPI0032679F71